MRLLAYIILLMYAELTYAQVSAPTLLGAVKPFAVTNTIIVSDAVTPAAGSMIVVAFAHRNATAVTLASVTDTFLDTGAWTIIECTREDVGTADISYAWAKAGPAPTLGAITATLSGSATRSVCAFMYVTGQHTTPILQSDNNDTTSLSTLTVTLASGVAAGSLTLGAVCSRAATDITDGSGETVVNETASGGTNPISLHIQRSTDQAHNWGALGTSTASFLIEIQQVATSTPNKVMVID